MEERDALSAALHSDLFGLFLDVKESVAVRLQHVRVLALLGEEHCLLLTPLTKAYNAAIRCWKRDLLPFLQIGDDGNGTGNRWFCAVNDAARHGVRIGDSNALGMLDLLNLDMRGRKE